MQITILVGEFTGSVTMVYPFLTQIFNCRGYNLSRWGTLLLTFWSPFESEELPDSRPGDVTPVESEAEDEEVDVLPNSEDGDDISLSLIQSHLEEKLPLSRFCEQAHNSQDDERIWTTTKKSTTVPEFTEPEGYDRQEFEECHTPTDVFLKFLRR